PRGRHIRHRRVLVGEGWAARPSVVRRRRTTDHDIHAVRRRARRHRGLLMSTDLLEATPKESATKVMSLKERLLSIPRGEPRPVDMSRFPGWPQGELFVRPPTAAAIAAWEADGLSFDSKGRPTVKVS